MNIPESLRGYHTLGTSKTGVSYVLLPKICKLYFFPTAFNKISISTSPFSFLGIQMKQNWMKFRSLSIEPWISYYLWWLLLKQKNKTQCLPWQWESGWNPIEPQQEPTFTSLELSTSRIMLWVFLTCRNMGEKAIVGTLASWKNQHSLRKETYFSQK